MKRTHLLLAAMFIGGILMTSCKKETATTPVNEEETENCSFCGLSMIEVDTTDTGMWYGTLAPNSFSSPAAFYHRDGSSTPPTSLVTKTPEGFYGFQQGLAIDFDFSNMLACTPNRVSFAHARNTVNTNQDPSFVNVKFPNTPLIACVADSLDYYLAPYGYNVQHYFYPGTVHMNMNNNTFAGVVDSLVITGPGFTTMTVGANLFESELRNVCVHNE